MKLTAVAQHVLAALEDPRAFSFKARHWRLVSFTFFKNLRLFARSSEGIRIDHVIDVGANAGQFAKMARYCWPTATIESFEPDADAAARFRSLFARDAKVLLHEQGLGATEAVVTMHRGSRTEQNSVLVEIDAPSNGAFTINITTLDQVTLAAAQNKRLLKLDVQGYELEVLHGAKALLRQTDYVLVELSLADIFKNGARIEEVWALLRANAFSFNRIMDTYHDPSTGLVTQMDVLFAHDQ
jgi:FkbM family methyltransferase